MTDGEKDFAPWLSRTSRAKLHDDGAVIWSCGVGWKRVVKLGFPTPARVATRFGSRAHISSSRNSVYWTRELVPRSVFQSGSCDRFWLRNVISTVGGLKLSLLCALGVGTVSSRAEILSFGTNSCS